LTFKRLAILSCAASVACVAPGVTAAAASAATPTLSGAGSTLVAPLEAEWASTWAQNSGNATPTYQAVGSGTGLKEIGQGLVDFGASDAPLSASTTPCGGCVQIPWALSATGVSYNIPGVRHLDLTGPVLAEIYLGQIKKWNDPRITSLNKGTHLPNKAITPIHREDGSGDSYAFTDFLSAVNGKFKHSVGRATKPTFPVGPGATGNSGMVTLEQQTSGSIAYVAVSYLIAHHLSAAAVKNAAGNYEVPNLANIADAASVVKSLPSTDEVHIVNPPKGAKIAYPISTFTYVILRPTDPFNNGAPLKAFVTYALTTGQRFAPALDFVKLPARIEQADSQALKRVH
jgi:phosphate transport system substrate-binding protein